MEFLSDNEYTHFDISLLKIDSVIDLNIYYKKDNEFVLAFSNGLLTEEKLKKLEKFELIYGGLYVDVLSSENSSDDDSLRKTIAKIKEEKKIYKSAISDCEKLINTCYDTQKINPETSMEVSKNISQHIVSTDEDNIIQFINNIKHEDKYLFTHSTNVAYLNGIMGKWLGFSEENINKLVVIGLLHDIGKINIPKEILNKPARLTKQEFEVIKLHPVYSFQILAKSGIKDQDILRAVRGHHEKNNGTGYPDGLSVRNLSIYTRITTISDIYDAMVAKRVYKDSNSPFDILDTFANGKFSNLDIYLVNVFLDNMPKLLLGKSVALSNGRIGKVHYINQNDYAHPFVRVGTEIIQTDNSLKCLYIF